MKEIMLKIMNIITKIGFISLLIFGGWCFDNHHYFTGGAVGCVAIIELVDRFFRKN
jgi:hypothetical protein